MRERRTFGFFLLFIFLLLAILCSVKVPSIKTNKFSISNPVEVPCGPNNFYNVTLEPLGKEDYHVEVEIRPYYVDLPMQVDFWAVNETWLDPLIEFVSCGIFEDDYPYNYPFNLTKSYAREINITRSRPFELVNLGYNGVYCLVLMNFFSNTQSVSVSVEERYVESFRLLLEPNLTNTIIATVIAAAGVYLVISSPKRSARKAKARYMMSRIIPAIIKACSTSAKPFGFRASILNIS